MENWNDDEWPINIRHKDETQKRLHKAVSAVFFLMMDCNDEALSVEEIRSICGARDDLPPAGEGREGPDEDYAHILDTMEALKVGLLQDMMGPEDADLAGISLADALDAHDDDFDALPAHPGDRRTTKPS